MGSGVAGSGGAELFAEGGQGAGAAGCGQRVQADVQDAAADGDVAAGVQGFADQGVGFVAGAGVAAVEGAGQDGFGVAGGHPDGVGDQLGLGVESDHGGVVLAERDLRGDGLGGLQVAAGGVDGGVQPGQGLVGDHGGGAGGGAAQGGEFLLTCGGGIGEGFLRGLDGGGGGFLRRVRDQPGGVLGGGGVGVEGVEGEVGAAVAEVVLLPPPGGHPVDHGGGGQRGGGSGGQDVDLAGVAGLAAGDLPQLQHAAFMLAFADDQADGGVGEVVLAGAAVVARPAGGAERVPGQVGDVLAGVVLAVGQQVGPGVGDAGEQGRGPAAAVEAQDWLRGGPGDVAQRGEQVADLGGQGR